MSYFTNRCAIRDSTKRKAIRIVVLYNIFSAPRFSNIPPGVLSLENAPLASVFVFCSNTRAIKEAPSASGATVSKLTMYLFYHGIELLKRRMC